MRRIAIFIALVSGLMFYGPAPVSAAGPVSTVISLDIVDPSVGEAIGCSFAVTGEGTGFIKRKDWFDASGNFIRTIDSIHAHITLINPATGVSIDFSNVGMDKVTITGPNSGIESAHGDRNSVVVQSEGAVAKNSGLQTWVFTFDDQLNLTSFVLVREAGQHDDVNAAACAALAP
jgi:hypothetical protein